MTDTSPDKRWRGRLAVPQHACPLVRQMFEIMNAERTLISDIAGRAGLRRGTISDWRYRRVPTLANFEAALNALGYELSISERK